MQYKFNITLIFHVATGHNIQVLILHNHEHPFFITHDLVMFGWPLVLQLQKYVDLFKLSFYYLNLMNQYVGQFLDNILNLFLQFSKSWK